MQYPLTILIDYLFIKAPVEPRNPSGSNGLESSGQSLPTRPPFTRADSRSNISPQSLRPGGPQLQQRPQFQAGGPVTSPPQFGPRPGTPVQRGPSPAGPPGSPQIRNQSPAIRPINQSVNLPQQGVRPSQSPTSAQPQRGPVPNNLQFGPRQPPQFVTTPNGTPKTTQGAPNSTQLPRQPSQSSLKGLDSPNPIPSKPANLENQVGPNENHNNIKPDSGNEVPGATKARSFSISAAPGSPNPLKLDDDRRKSVSAVSGRYDDLVSRSSGLGLIQEMRGSKDIIGSKESVKSEASNEGKDIPDRPESRLAGSKMTESFIGSYSNTPLKKKIDDDDDVISQNNLSSMKNDTCQNKTDLSDRSPSLTRSDDSPEPKNVSQQSATSNKTPSGTPEPQRPKTPKSDIKQEIKSESNKEIKPTVTPTKIVTKSPTTESKSPLESKSPISLNKKPTELKTSITPSDSKKSTPRKVASAPSSRPKGNS